MEDLIHSPRRALQFALVVMGLTATAFQVLIIRELLIVFHGNELSIGIILGNWLILEAIGCFYARKRADASQKHISSFAALQALTGLFSVASIAFVRSFKYLFGLPSGELLGIHYVALISFISLAPVALLDGSLFPYGCRNFSAISREKEAAGYVYLYQAAGAFLAGLVFVIYLVYYLDSMQLAAIILLCNLCSAAVYLQASGHAKILKRTAAVFLVCVIFSFGLSVPKWLGWNSSKLMWYEYPLIETINSVYSNIAVIKKEGEYTFFLNGAPHITTPSPGMHVEEAAHFPMLFHEAPENVLIVGGGAGGVINEALKHPVAKIDYAEQDPFLIKALAKFKTPLTEQELNHPKVKLHLLEGRLFLRKTEQKYDVILVNMPIPSTLQINRYYTTDFFRLAAERLNDKGIFAVKLPGSETFLSKELEDINKTLYFSLKDSFAHVRIIIGETNIFLASDDGSVMTVSHAALAERLAGRGIKANLINDRYLRYKLDKERFGTLEDAIKSQSVESIALNEDSNPRSVLQSMLYLNLISSPFMVEFLKKTSAVPLIWYMAVILISLPVFAAIQYKLKSGLFIKYAVFTTGFAGMFLNVLLIFMFQIYYGYVYYYIGFLASVFMLGLALGSYVILKKNRPGLLFIEVFLFSIILMLYLFLLFKPQAGIIPQAAIFGLMFFAGAATGMEYPAAVRASERDGAANSLAAGSYYALDLTGAFLGALVSAVVLIPALGIKNSLILVATTKACSLAVVWIGNRRGKSKTA